MMGHRYVRDRTWLAGGERAAEALRLALPIEH